METKVAHFYFEDSDLLETAANSYNERYRSGSRSCELKISEDEKPHQLKIISTQKLLPYSIFEIGFSIGQKWMHKYYRIVPNGWKKLYNINLFKGEVYPSGQTFPITVNNNKIVDIYPYDATHDGLLNDGILPFISDSDYNSISDFSSLISKETATWKYSRFNPITNRQPRYFLKENYLFVIDAVFYGNPVEITLISAFEVKITGV